MKQILTALLGTLAVITSADAAVVAYWNFNGQPNMTSGDASGVAITADQGSGTFTATRGRSNKVRYRTDNGVQTTVNALGGDPAGTGLWMRDKMDGWNFAMTGLDFSGLEDVSITLAHNALTTDLFSFEVQYNLGLGGGWQAAIADQTYATTANNGTYEVLTLDLSGIAAIEGQSGVSLRMANIRNQNTTNAFFGTDNYQVLANAVPEPSTYALIAGALALGVIMIRRRRS